MSGAGEPPLMDGKGARPGRPPLLSSLVHAKFLTVLSFVIRMDINTSPSETQQFGLFPAVRRLDRLGKKFMEEGRRPGWSPGQIAPVPSRNPCGPGAKAPKLPAPSCPYANPGASSLGSSWQGVRGRACAAASAALCPRDVLSQAPGCPHARSSSLPRNQTCHLAGVGSIGITCPPKLYASWGFSPKNN